MQKIWEHTLPFEKLVVKSTSLSNLMVNGSFLARFFLFCWSAVDIEFANPKLCINEKKSDRSIFRLGKESSVWLFAVTLIFIGRTSRKALPQWYLISRVFNLAIWAREYFAGFYFRDFHTQIWEKGIKIRDLSFLNFILFVKKVSKFSNF